MSEISKTTPEMGHKRAFVRQKRKKKKQDAKQLLLKLQVARGTCKNNKN